jgi:hypothetical protein
MNDHMNPMSTPTSSMTYLFASSHYEPFELGAKLIATLAFPSPQEIDPRQRAFEALCAQVIHATCAADPNNAASWRAKFPTYAAIGEPEIRRRLRTLRRRLRDRMKAAQIALGYFDEALRHTLVSIGEAYPDLKPEIEDIEVRPTPLPGGVVRHSFNALIQHHFPHHNEEGWHNREQRALRSSLPVIHVAVAFHVLGRHLAPGAEGFAYKLDDLEIHQRILELAEVHETALECEWARRHEAGEEGSSTFMIDPGVLIRCRAEKSPTVDFEPSQPGP